MSANNKILVMPNPVDERLTQKVQGLDQDKKKITTSVTVERPLTLFLNGQEIVTMMSICDYPEFLAVGYLVNQNMLADNDEISEVEYEEDIEKVYTDRNKTAKAKTYDRLVYDKRKGFLD